MTSRLFALGLLAASAAPATAAVYITEWMYNGSEFVEFTNIGVAPVDMTGWSYYDSDRIPGGVDLSAFGVVAPGESVILAEDDEAAFRAEWGLGAGVKVIGGLTVNLSRNDEINLYNAANELVDRLTFGDQDFSGSIRTQNVSGFTSPSNYGANDVYDWQLSVAGENGAYASFTNGYVGSPGIAAVPEPSAAMLSLLACCGLFRRRMA